MEKVCNNCKVVKNISNFTKSNDGKYGVRGSCKNCCSMKSLERFNKNRAKNLEKKMKHYYENKEYYSNKARKWREKNREKTLENSRRYNRNNKEKILKLRSEYNEKNKDRINELARTGAKKRRMENPLIKLSTSLRTRMRQFFIRSNILKTESVITLLGVDVLIAKKHIEKQFTKGMTWENYGRNGWHIDHIIPLNSAKTEEELRCLCHYKNLQPMWASDNIRKGSKILNSTQTFICI